MRRGLRFADLVLAALVLAALWGLATWTREAPLEGAAFAIDGDTVSMEGTRIRLRGLDAPELGQICRRGEATYRCGEEARAALRGLLADRTIVCAAGGRDRWRRVLARCMAGGEDVGAALVRRGLAVADGGYAAEEREARQGRRGLWAGEFERPRDWRRRHEAGEGA